MIQQVHNSQYLDLLKQIIALVTIIYRLITLQELTFLIGRLEGIKDDLESINEVIGYPALSLFFKTILNLSYTNRQIIGSGLVNGDINH